MEPGENGWARVVQAKLGVPALRADTIVRERLVALLDDALEHPLTVVCAPAGYGKTTAVATWLSTVEHRRAWVSLDSLDGDPRRLCAHLLAALDGALPGVVEAAWQALIGGADPVETVIPVMAGALGERVEGRLVLVLDDFQQVEHPDGQALVGAVIDALPASARMVLCSRTMPALRVARRRTLGTIAELGWRELAFQGDESDRLLNGSLGLGLDRDAVGAIASRVEGWPAGLALVASSLPERADRDRYLRQFGERHPDVTVTAAAEYLVDEVLDRAEPRLREFLCRTSVLSRLSGPLCAAVLEDRSAGELLAEVRRSNLFVTALGTDGHGEWLRYHHLFAELLERELRSNSPELVPVLHQRACEWYAANDMPEDAIGHATAAGDGQRAATLLHDNWPHWVRQRRYVTLRRMIARLPADRGQLAPFCELLDVLCISQEGADLRVVAERLDALEQFRNAPGVEPLIDHMRVSPFSGDVGRAVKDGWAAWERYAELRFRALLSGQFGLVLWFAGDRDAVHRVVEPLVSEIDPPTPRSWALAALALVAADEGNPDLAEHYGRQAVEATAVPEVRDALETHAAYIALAEALRLQGAIDEAADKLAHALSVTRRHPTSLYHAFTLVFDAQLQLARRARAAARARATEARAIVDRYPDVGVLEQRLARIEHPTERRNDDRLPGTKPTRSEQRILAMLPTDLTFEQIAAELYVSLNTVEWHRRRLYRRLGATSREQATEIARQRGLL